MAVISVILIFWLSLQSFTNGKHVRHERNENDRFEQIVAGGIILNENFEDKKSEGSILIFATDEEGNKDNTERESQGNVDVTIGLLMFATGKKMEVESEKEEEAISPDSAKKQNLQAIERLFNNKSTKKHLHKSHTHDKVTHNAHHEILPSARN